MTYSSIKKPSYEEALKKAIEKQKKARKKKPLAKRSKLPSESGSVENDISIVYPPKHTPRTKKPTKKPHAKIPLSSSKLKRELDRVFSLYIRKIYPPFCYTCGKPAERLQNGHYISRQYLATRWSIDNCRPQCWGCNGYGKGQPLIFEEKLKAEYGNDFVENMKAGRHQIIKLDRKWYQVEIERYKALLDE